MFLKQYSDSHTHYRDAVRYVEHLSEMRAAGLQKIAFLALSIRPWGFSGAENWEALYVKRRAAEVPVYAFGSLTYDYFLPPVPYEEQAKLLWQLGFDGMKFIEMKPLYRRRLGFGLNHPRYDKTFAYLEQMQIPVILHVCDPDENWTHAEHIPNQEKRGLFYGDGSVPTKAEMNAEIFEVLDRYPRLNVVLAHFFFMSNDIDEAVRVMEKYPGVKFDLTPGIRMYLGFSRKIEQWHDFFMKYRHRILYGTDSNETNIKLHELVAEALTHDHSEFETPLINQPIRGLQLDDDTVHMIAVENFDRYFGREPRPLNEALMREVQERITEHLALNKPTHDYAQAYIRPYVEKMMRV